MNIKQADTGTFNERTFNEVRAPEEVILETCNKMFSQNEEGIKEEIEDPTNEETPPQVKVPEQPKGNEELDKIIAKESTNMQWVKLILNFAMLVSMAVCMVLRGSPDEGTSVIGLKLCDTPSHVFLLFIVGVAALLTFIAVRVARDEHEQKTKAGYTFVRGDLEYTGVTVFKLVLIGFVGAFLATSVGIGPGAVFTPVMIQLDMHSAVASSTGMYLTMLTTIAATVNMLVYKRLDVVYMLVLCGLSIVGSIPGILMQPYIRQKAGGRTQIMVMILISSLVLIAATLSPYMVFEVINAKEHGHSDDVWAFKPYCPSAP